MIAPMVFQQSSAVADPLPATPKKVLSFGSPNNSPTGLSDSKTWSPFHTPSEVRVQQQQTAEMLADPVQQPTGKMPQPGASLSVDSDSPARIRVIPDERTPSPSPSCSSKADSPKANKGSPKAARKRPAAKASQKKPASNRAGPKGSKPKARAAKPKRCASKPKARASKPKSGPKAKPSKQSGKHKGQALKKRDGKNKKLKTSRNNVYSRVYHACKGAGGTKEEAWPWGQTSQNE